MITPTDVRKTPPCLHFLLAHIAQLPGYRSRSTDRADTGALRTNKEVKSRLRARNETSGEAAAFFNTL